jgi:hypothetical protein
VCAVREHEEQRCYLQGEDMKDTEKKSSR